MNTERNDLRRRVARHAALADATRLRIVDLLILGDRSPTELQTALGISSNLLAHHLNLLEQAGIVRRSKSEADGRSRAPSEVVSAVRPEDVDPTLSAISEETPEPALPEMSG